MCCDAVMQQPEDAVTLKDYTLKIGLNSGVIFDDFLDSQADQMDFWVLLHRVRKW